MPYKDAYIPKSIFRYFYVYDNTNVYLYGKTKVYVVTERKIGTVYYDI